MVDKVQRRYPGDPFQIPAGEFNVIADSANFVQRLQSEKRGIGIFSRALAEVYPHEVTDALGVVALDDIALDGLGDRKEERVNFSSATLEEKHIGKFGVAQNGGGQNEMLPTVVSGTTFCRLYVPDNGEWITRADADITDKSRLEAIPHGSAQILWKEAGVDTTVDAIVRFGNAQNVVLAGKTVAEVTPNSANNRVIVWLNRTTNTDYEIPDVHLDWMHNDEGISADIEVLICWFPDEKIWRFIGAACEDGVTTEPPAIGQLGDTGTGTDQSLTTTPVPWNPFDQSASFGTPNVTVDAPTASITIPANPDKENVYRYDYAGVVTPGSNNSTYAFDFTVDGVPNAPLLVDGRQAGSSLSFGFGGLVRVPSSPSPHTIQCRVRMDSGTDTMTWNGASFTLEKNLDFSFTSEVSGSRKDSVDQMGPALALQTVDFTAGEYDNKQFDIVSTTTFNTFLAVAPGEYQLWIKQDATGNHNVFITVPIDPQPQTIPINAGANQLTVVRLYYDGTLWHLG